MPENTLKTELELELEPFSVPNFVRTKASGGFRSLHISELKDETIHELVNQFSKDLFAVKAKGKPPSSVSR